MDQILASNLKKTKKIKKWKWFKIWYNKKENVGEADITKEYQKEFNRK